MEEWHEGPVAGGISTASVTGDEVRGELGHTMYTLHAMDQFEVCVCASYKYSCLFKYVLEIHREKI